MCLLIGENERKRSNLGIETLEQKRVREIERERDRENERR